MEEKCIALRCLDISNIQDIHSAKEVLRATRGRLRKLKAEGSHTSGIALYCAGLLKLEIYDAPSDVNFLKEVGQTLKVLSMWSHDNKLTHTYSKQVLELTRAFCPNLVDIAVRVNPEHLSEFADLLCSYGENLLWLSVRQFTADMCGRLVAACPRMVFKNMVRYSPDVGVLGTRVRQLGVEFFNDVDVAQLALDIQPCSEIELIELAAVQGNAGEAVGGLLKFDKPELTCFSLSMWEGFGDKALLQLARRPACKRLRSLEYVEFLYAVSICAPLLENVAVTLPSDSFGEEDDRDAPEFDERVRQITEVV